MDDTPYVSTMQRVVEDMITKIHNARENGFALMLAEFFKRWPQATPENIRLIEYRSDLSTSWEFAYVRPLTPTPGEVKALTDARDQLANLGLIAQQLAITIDREIPAPSARITNTELDYVSFTKLTALGLREQARLLLKYINEAAPIIVTEPVADDAELRPSERDSYLLEIKEDDGPITKDLKVLRSRMLRSLEDLTGGDPLKTDIVRWTRRLAEVIDDLEDLEEADGS